MKLGHTLSAGIALAVAFAAPSIAQAAAVSYFGNNPTANGGVVLQDPSVALSLDPVRQRNNFLSSLTTSQTEAFNMAPISALGTLNDLFSNGSGISLTTGGGQAGVNGEVRRTNGSPWHGRFNTTGDPVAAPLSGTTSTSGWFETNRSSVSIDFLNSVSAFGTFFTDVGDFEGALKVEVFGASGLLYSSDLILAGARNGNGGLAFFGYTNTTQFNRVLFSITQPSGIPTDEFDFIGLDGFITGTLRSPGPGGTIPEPTSLALVGLSLALLGSVSRRRNRT